MTEIVRPEYGQLWAEEGTSVPPPPDKISEGWTAEIPPFQYDNWINKRQDQAIGYLLQRGIAGWDASTEYFAGKSVVVSAGKIYIALQSGINNDPQATTGFWQAVVPENVAQKLRIKRVTLPYTLVKEDAGAELLASGTGNITAPANVFAEADWVIISKQTSGQTSIVGGSGMVVYNQFQKNNVLGGTMAKCSLTFVSPTGVELMGDFQYVL